MDMGGQSDVSLSQNFRNDDQAQYAQSQYPYPHGTNAFSNHQAMALPDNFAATTPRHANQPLDDSHTGSSTTTNGQVSSSGPTSAGNAPGMAPPQPTPSQPYSSPSGLRTSVDESQEAGMSGMSGGEPKRKRSKVSRACDECRRKKVRCDAAADDGTIKTCTNCARANLTCEYSRIPMKRGPSKGYIKELSERVQQVESLQMALTNTPGYRQSLDGSTAGLYAEQVYSPEDSMSGKRNFSFSDQRNPFSNPEFNRDRIPSIGSWATSSPHASGFRLRDRASIAIAPDQQPPTNPPTHIKPFWATHSDLPRPTKRLKMDQPESPPLGTALLAKYYQDFHTNLPILPDVVDTCLSIVEKASPIFQHALCAAVTFLPSPRSARAQNGEAGADGLTPLTLYKTKQDLQSAMWEITKESPEMRSEEDNLLYLWVLLFMAVEADNDLTRLRDGVMSKTVIMKHAVDLGRHCITEGRISTQDSPSEDRRGPYAEHFARAWYCTAILGRLHALAVGANNPIATYEVLPVPLATEILPAVPAFLAMSSDILAPTITMIRDVFSPEPNVNRTVSVMCRNQILTFLAIAYKSAQLNPDSNDVVASSIHFFNLVLSRHTELIPPLDILLPATELGEALCKQTAASTDQIVYSPLSVHHFTLSTITLLEFMQEGIEPEHRKHAAHLVRRLQGALERISERDRNEEEQHGTEDGQEQSAKPLHWVDALLKLVDDRMKVYSAGNDGGNATNEQNVAVQFTMLLRVGYLTALLRTSGL